MLVVGNGKMKRTNETGGSRHEFPFHVILFRGINKTYGWELDLGAFFS